MAKPISAREATANRSSLESEIKQLNTLLALPWTETEHDGIAFIWDSCGHMACDFTDNGSVRRQRSRRSSRQHVT